MSTTIPMSECPLCHTDYSKNPSQMVAVRLWQSNRLNERIGINQYICQACLNTLQLPSRSLAETTYACNDDSCHEKAKAKGEQRFTLRAQDKTAPECIVYWILKNIETAPEHKLRHALDDALRARRWPNRKRAD